MPILVFRVKDKNFRAHHQTAQNFQFNGIALSRARFGEDDGVVVLQRKAVKENEGVVVGIDSKKNAVVRT